MVTLEKAIELVDAELYNEAFESFQLLKEKYPENAEVYYYLGKLLYKKQNFGDAINMYLKALEIEPSMKKAEIGIRVIRNIVGISNSFYFENPYTDENLISNL